MVSLMNQVVFYSGSLILGYGISQYVLYVLLRVRRISGKHKKAENKNEKLIKIKRRVLCFRTTDIIERKCIEFVRGKNDEADRADL